MTLESCAERSQAQKAAECMIPLEHNVQGRDVRGDRKQSGFQGWEEGDLGVAANWWFPFGVMERSEI